MKINSIMFSAFGELFLIHFHICVYTHMGEMTIMYLIVVRLFIEIVHHTYLYVQ